MINKKSLFISGLAIIIAILLLIMIHKETPQKIIMAEGEMPDFKFRLIDGGFIQRADMDSKKFTLMMFFYSDCNLCINETQALVDSISLLNDCQIVMVSHEDSIKIAEFYERFRLMDFPSIHVAYVHENTVRNMFTVYMNPTFYIYHPDRRMIKYKPGPITVHEIVQYLKNNL